MAHLPRLLVLPFLFLFLGIHVPASHGSPLPRTYDGSMCSKSLCGSVNIRYPFYLSNATRETADYTSYSCGYTDLNISCQGEGESKIPIIQLGNDSYTIKNIFYDNHTIMLADADALRSTSCFKVSHNVTFDREFLNYTSSYDNLTFFYGCHFDPRDTVPPGLDKDTYKIDCAGSDGPSGLEFSFVFTSEEHGMPQEYDLAGNCRQIFVAPVQRDFLMMTSNLPMFTRGGPGGYGDVLKNGFELTWNRNTTKPCHLCEESYGQCAYSQKREFLGCLCTDGKVGIQDCNNSGASSASPPSSASSASPPSSGRKKVAPIAGAVVGGFSALLVAVVIAILFIRKRKQQVTSSSKLLKYSGSGETPRSRGGDMESGSIQDLQTHLFSYEELEEATDSFNDSRELGDGGFGIVYKGFLRDGRVVAVKRLYNNTYRSVEQFVNEAAILSQLRHPNLVLFYGCTSRHSRELLLVYEFVPNGTVADHLHGHRAPERALTWPLRLNIAVESAAALTYLHAIEPPVVHRDVKTNNILLDANFHVKVADFGLSRLFPLDVTHVSTVPQGTPGYLDPEYHQCYQLTDKSDVYSFGVVLVELISSKPAVDITRQRNEINLAGMAINKIQKCQLEELVDLELGYESDPATKKMMTMVAELAFRCLQQNSEMRPPIKEVLEVLRGIQGGCVMEKDGDKDKGLVAPCSPDTVHAPWDSKTTTPNTSQ